MTGFLTNVCVLFRKDTTCVMKYITANEIPLDNNPPLITYLRMHRNDMFEEPVLIE